VLGRQDDGVGRGGCVLKSDGSLRLVTVSDAEHLNLGSATNQYFTHKVGGSIPGTRIGTESVGKLVSGSNRDKLVDRTPISDNRESRNTEPAACGTRGADGLERDVEPRSNRSR